MRVMLQAKIEPWRIRMNGRTTSQRATTLWASGWATDGAVEIDGRLHDAESVVGWIILGVAVGLP